VLQQLALQNQAAMIAKWDGKLPAAVVGGNPFVALGPIPSR
jgi:hypothetical protein